MTDPADTPFADYPANLSDWSEAQLADFAAWFEQNFVADDASLTPTFANTAAAVRYAELRDAFYKARLEETQSEQDAAAGKKPRARGKAKADDRVWIVTRARGLHAVEAATVDAAVAAGARLATARDLKVAGVEQ